MDEQQHFGRNRESLAGLIEQLEEIFKTQPSLKKTPDGQLVLPVGGVREVLKILFEQANMPPFTEQDEASLKSITSQNPDLELTPANLLQFVAQLTANMPKEQRIGHFPRKSSPSNEAYILGHRGRRYERNGSGDSRSSSSDSLDARPFDDPDETHQYSRRVPPSPFDARARQRAGPVEPPSSWSGKRPVPAARRRKSDAGGSNYGGSDNESAYGHGNGTSRRRTSNPVSPVGSYQQSGMVTPPHHRQGSDRGYHSRPHSRSHSSLGNGMSASYRSESPDAVLVQYSPPRPNSVPMPAGEGQTEGEEATEGQESDLVPDPRLSMVSFTSSTGDSVEQTEALRKALAEMTRRAAEQERSLQEQLAARELDIEDIQAQLENTRDLISMLKKDEKEWRSKERHYVTQINGLEADVNKLQRNLDNARAQHQTLTKQYSEQCAEADKYRNQVRMRDGDIRELEHRLATVEHEVDKARADHTVAEEQIQQLQAELNKANQVHTEYLNQKQENVLLKETIDRLRYDLDDLRSAHANDSTKGGSAPGSAKPSLSRTLGSELLRRLHPHEEKVAEEDSDTETTVEETVEERSPNEDGDEDIFQTIITRKRVVTKGKRAATVQETVLVDATTQYDNELFAQISGVQTDGEDQYKPIASTSRSGVQVKVEPSSPRSRLLHPLRDDPPSYQLSEIEQSGEETLDILRKWHGVKVLGPLPGGISREAIEDWHALKRELGIKCPIIEEIIEQSDKQASGSRFPSGFGFSPMRRENAKRYVEGGKRRFYNIYNTYILGGDRTAASTSGATSSNQDNAGVVNVVAAGKWVVAFSAWSAFLLWYGSTGEVGRLDAPGGASYTDRALWGSFNALAGGEGFGVAGVAPPVDAVGAVWFVVEKLVRGATDIATRRVAFPS